MAVTRKGQRAAEQVARAAGDSYGVVLDPALERGDRNARLARRWSDGAANELRERERVGHELSRQLVEQAEKQREAIQTLAGRTLEAYVELLYSPLAYYGPGARRVEDNVRSFPGVWAVDGGFPIRGYDEMSVAEISGRIDGLSVGQTRRLREYEKQHKNRGSLIEQFDRKLRNAS